jgi:polar amino acid transport system substrate-binding protein
MNLKHLLTVALFAAVSTLGVSADKVLVNVDEANAPFMCGKDGKAEGIYPALIQAAFKRMKVDISIQPKPWKQALQEMDEGAAGVGGIYKNAERLKKYDYSEQLFNEKLVVYFNLANPVNYTKIDDLKGKRVGILRGWSYGDEFDGARKAGLIAAEEVGSDEQNFQKLDLGRLDAVIAVSEAGNDLMRTYTHVDSAATPLAENPSFLAFPKSASRTALLKQFDQAMTEIRQSGEFKKIFFTELAK